jgi:hypothetical protein
LKAHQKEIANMVQESNRKYNLMLNERMNLESKLEQQIRSLQADLKQQKEV